MQLEINGKTYQTGRLDAFKQFHVARRLAPVLWALGSGAVSLLKVLKVDPAVEELDNGALVQALTPLIEAMSQMSDTDAQYVLNTCLAVCTRQEGQGWAKVFVEPGGLVFQEMDLSVIFQLVVAVIRENMGNFTSALPGLGQPAGGQSQT